MLIDFHTSAYALSGRNGTSPAHSGINRNSIKLIGSSAIGSLDLYPNKSIIFINGNELSYQYITDYEELSKNHIGTINLHTIVQDPNPRGFADGRNLSMYGITVDEFNLVPESPYADAPDLSLTDAYVNCFTTSSQVNLTKYLPADLNEASRFKTNVNTLIVNTDRQVPIQTEDVRVGNLVVLGNNRNLDGGIAVSDKKVGLFDNIILLGSNMTFTNYEKRSGKPAVGTLYVSNRGLEFDEVTEIIRNADDPLQSLLEKNGQKSPEDVRIPYYITLNYTNIDNVRYSSEIPEPNIMKNNETVLLGTVEGF